MQKHMNSGAGACDLDQENFFLIVLLAKRLFLEAHKLQLEN